MEVQGSCYCGEVTYRAEVSPAEVVVCHCVDCQILTGTAYRVSVPAKAENFTLLSGEPKVFLKLAESGNRRAHSFCGNCGSPLFATSADDKPSLYMLRVGTLAERASLAPQREIWCRSALPWALRLETKSRKEKQ